MAKSISNTEGNDHTDQPNAVLETKLYIPQPRPKLVPRPNLIARLNDGIQSKLTLISAPAGFGKTTLLIDWINQTEIQVSWISLDAEDGNSLRFLTYLVSAIHKIHPAVGVEAISSLHSSQPLQIEAVLTNLINEIASIPNSFVIVLDDYHLIDEKQIHDIIEFLLDHLPQNMHVVIATRSDPPLSLARLRSRNHLSEFRASDLNFHTDETTDFLNRVMTLDLSKESIAVLESRTEGWIAGLQLAALSMQGRDNIPAFIKAFTGDDRHIVDYLAEEVLNRQSEPIRNFLLHTSILNRLSGSLCNAVTERADGQQVLDELEKLNLFIVPLDNKRHWYRYHHLFADLLQHLLQQSNGEHVKVLHGRASSWYEQNGMDDKAIEHALEANDFERVAYLAELAWPACSGSYQSIEWLGWLRHLPDEVVRARPVLCQAYAWAFLHAGNLEAAESRLRDAEKWLEPTGHTSDRLEAHESKMVVADENQYRGLPISLAMARAYYSQAIGDISSTIQYAKIVLNLLPDEDIDGRGPPNALLGLAYWTSGDLEAAHTTIFNGMTDPQKIGDKLGLIAGTFVLADIKMTLGYLNEAKKTCELGLILAKECGNPLPIGTEDIYTGLSHLHREWSDLKSAADNLKTSRQLGEQIELPDWQYRWFVAKSQLEHSQGNWERALDFLDEAERVYVRTPLPEIRPVKAIKARVWIRQGRLKDALAWVHEKGISNDGDISYLHEYESITLARLLIAKYVRDKEMSSIEEAKSLLERILNAANNGRRTSSVIEILVLQTLAHDAQGDIQVALLSLARALTLAEPEGFVRIFVDEGPAMADLLEKVLDAKVDVPQAYVKKLLLAFRLNKLVETDDGIVEHPSDREIEVLGFVAAGLSNKKISEELFISMSTVKTHINHIYSKLGVHSRIEAVAKAKELGLL